MELKLTNADITAIENGDGNFINNKGASFYSKQEYDKAVEYYRLAASMGNLQAVSNLGYCYLYGRDIEDNLSLALGYFKIASKRGSVDASYKLGDIYGSDKWGIKDSELSIYYYRLAADQIVHDEWDYIDIMSNEELMHYPSLCFALGREMGIGGLMNTDIDMSYQFLTVAKKGYEAELANGEMMHEESYRKVLEYLDKEEYQRINEKHEIEISEELS